MANRPKDAAETVLSTKQCIERDHDPQMDSGSGLFTVGGYWTLLPNRYWAVSIGVPGKSDIAEARVRIPASERMNRKQANHNYLTIRLFSQQEFS